MSTQEVADKVVELTRKLAWHEALETLYAPEIVSVEATRGEARGIDAVREKVEWWENAMECHGVEVTGPFVARDQFVVRYDMDVTDKNSDKRMQLSEVGVYTVKDGKIAREEFFPYTGAER